VPRNINSGQIDFDPAHSYCTVAYEYSTSEKLAKGTQRGTLKYDIVQGIPVLKSVADIRDMRHVEWGLLHGEEKWTFEMEYGAAVPSQEFRLTHYCLPEPVGVTWPTRTRWYLWFIVAGAAALAVGAYFWRRVQCRKTTTVKDAVIQQPRHG
jgi:hypothetical protein